MDRALPVDAEGLAASQPDERHKPPEEPGLCDQALVTVALLALLIGAVFFLALVVVPAAGAAGGCGGG